MSGLKGIFNNWPIPAMQQVFNKWQVVLKIQCTSVTHFVLFLCAWCSAGCAQWAHSVCKGLNRVYDSWELVTEACGLSCRC